MVGKIKVIFTPKVIADLDNLVQILYKKEYFGFIESAEEYVSRIYDATSERCQLDIHKIAPKNISHLGTYYIFYKSNKRTTWYIFFEKKATAILITGISNNHCEEAKGL